ncbi:hypothetical protein [Alloactinosynnema sp. L-07]|uniref:hypothetical protein n=1 Tax=Alloactinosynnema sp. L-07 TaxID=1653480 RepID=UPI00065EFA91|nr:hypothetical protein [Alloactinosynnema sp. L-07]CRK59249.1 hypothetical protein [Alloactinosynnema sp. L-07]
MLTICFVELGLVEDIDLVEVCRIINRSQRAIRAIVGPEVTALGEPDISAIGYSLPRLFAVLAATAEPEQVMVGITRAPIERNLFGSHVSPGLIILSLHQVQEVCVSSGRTTEEYLAQSAITELLQLLYVSSSPDALWTDLAHDEVRGCLFDYVPNKIDKAVKLRCGHLDQQCRARLIESGVAADLLVAADKLLRRIQSPTLGRTLRQALQQPVFSLLLGGVLGGLIINLVSSAITDSFTSRSASATAVAALMALGVITFPWLRARRSARKLRRWPASATTEPSAISRLGGMN